jgi:endonuclease-3
VTKAKAARAAQATQVLDRLEREHSDAKCALEFETPLELLVATILAAQARDESVNQVTRGLFQKYRKASDWATSPPGVLEKEVGSLGFFNQKSKSIRAATKDLVERFGGEVPRDLDQLVTLHGVGRKTANVILGNAYGVPDRVAVDTHVLRLSQRLGWTDSKDPDQVEKDVEALVPADRRTRACHLLQFHGRRICHAKKPECERCPVNDLCPSAFTFGEEAAPKKKGGAKKKPRRAK